MKTRAGRYDSAGITGSNGYSVTMAHPVEIERAERISAVEAQSGCDAQSALLRCNHGDQAGALRAVPVHQVIAQ